MRTPCETNSRSGPGEVPCGEKSRPWILAATILASSMAFIDSTAINIALPALQKSLHATVVDVQWVVEAYGLFLGALILVGGTLGDLFGRRLIFVLGTILFAAASAGCAIAPDIQMLIVARSFQGVGAAFLVPGSLAIISASFDAQGRGKAIGTWSGWTAITTAVGPVLGGWLVEHASWRWVFIINLPVAAVVIGISLWRIPESRGATVPRIDWAGALLATLGLGGLVFGFIESNGVGFGNPLVIGSLVAAVGCLLGCAALEARISFPMIPLALFRNRNFSGANLLTLFLYAAVGVFFFFLPMSLIQVQGYSATDAGAAILPFIALMFLLSRWSGGLVAHYGAGKPLVVGPLVVAFGFLLFMALAAGGDYWKTVFPAMTVLGLGMAITVAPLTTDVMNAVEQDRVGVASGINNAVARVAGVLGIAVLGIAMVLAFRARLDRELNHLSLPPGVRLEIQARETKLGGLQPPASLDAPAKASVTVSIHTAFVSGFRIVMMICAGLSMASAVIAWSMICKSK